MSSLPQLGSPWRVPRAYLDGDTPAVLRLPTGERIAASLRIVSLTGGMLSVSQPVVQGSRAKLMFLTKAGSVLGGAEMLCPITNFLQPFRFFSIAADDQHRLGAFIWERLGQNKFEQVWIEKLRAASAEENEVPPWRFNLAEALALLTLGLATVAYFLHPGLLN